MKNFSKIIIASFVLLIIGTLSGCASPTPITLENDSVYIAYTKIDGEIYLVSLVYIEGSVNGDGTEITLDLGNNFI